jgi:hypothetical protein
MTDGRIDVEINDKVSSGVEKKIRGIASAAREAEGSLNALKAQIANINNTGINKLASDVAKATNAQARQTSAQARLNNSNAKLQASTTKAAIAQQKLATETARTQAAQSRANAATSRAAAAATAQEIAVSRLAVAKQREAIATDQVSNAQRRNNRIRQTGSRSRRQQLQQTQNLIFQLNDVVVGLASGQKPLTVLIQQGSQISTIFGPGNGVLGTLRLLGGTLASILIPLLPIVAVVGAIGAGVALLSNEINKSTKVSVSFGDTFKAVFQVAYSQIKDLFLPAIESVAPVFKTVYNFVIDTTKSVINGVIGFWVGAFNSVTKAWGLFPAAMKDLGVTAMNGIIGVVESGVNAILNAVGDLLEFIGRAAELVGRDNPFEGLLDGKVVDLDSFKGEVTGAAQEVGNIFAEEFTKAASTDFAGQAFDAIRNQAIENAKKRAAEQAKAEGGANKQLSEKEKLLQRIKAPLTEYTTTLANLNALLAEGKISLAEYNTALSNTTLSTDLRGVDSSLEGTGFQEDAQLEELRIQQQERIAIIQQAAEARIITEEQAAARIRAVNEQLARDTVNIEAQRNSMILQNAQSTFDSLASVAAGFAGEQSGIYKAMFVTSKAFAIADSIIKIQQGIANALSLPFPANLGAAAAVAAQAASIVSTIQSIQFTAGGGNGGQQLADGGPVRGPGGPRDDMIPAMLSNGEFVVNANSTRRHRALLEAINDNAPTPRFRDGGLVPTGPRQVQNAAAARGSVGGQPVGGGNPSQRSQVVININAQDAKSVIASKGQVAAALTREVNRGYRNL